MYMTVEKGMDIMRTISFRINEDDLKLIQEYAQINNLNLSSFIRDTIMEKVKRGLTLDEERILKARAQLKTDKTYDHTEVWKELGI